MYISITWKEVEAGRYQSGRSNRNQWGNWIHRLRLNRKVGSHCTLHTVASLALMFPFFFMIFFWLSSSVYEKLCFLNQLWGFFSVYRTPVEGIWGRVLEVEKGGSGLDRNENRVRSVFSGLAQCKMDKNPEPNPLKYIHFVFIIIILKEEITSRASKTFQILITMYFLFHE